MSLYFYKVCVKKINTISFDTFNSIELISGTIIKTEEFPRAKKPAFKVWVDFGPKFGILQTSAQITVHYTLESLIGKQVVGCVNLGEKNIGGFLSQFLLVGFPDANGAVCLMTVDPKVPNGSKAF
jgi:tRNA-binding protein